MPILTCLRPAVRLPVFNFVVVDFVVVKTATITVTARETLCASSLGECGLVLPSCTVTAKDGCISAYVPTLGALLARNFAQFVHMFARLARIAC